LLPVVNSVRDRWTFSNWSAGEEAAVAAELAVELATRSAAPKPATFN
jgi:hypothetical protein